MLGKLSLTQQVSQLYLRYQSNLEVTTRCWRPTFGEEGRDAGGEGRGRRLVDAPFGSRLLEDEARLRARGGPECGDVVPPDYAHRGRPLAHHAPCAEARGGGFVAQEARSGGQPGGEIAHLPGGTAPDREPPGAS